MAARGPQSAEFIAEAKEHLADVCDQLLRFERAAGDVAKTMLEALLRAVHSVKGGAGFFGFRNIETLAHRMESLVESLMEGTVPRDSHAVDALLAGTDRIAAMLDDVEHSNEFDIADLFARIDAPEVREHGFSTDDSLGLLPHDVAIDGHQARGFEHPAPTPLHEAMHSVAARSLARRRAPAAFGRVPGSHVEPAAALGAAVKIGQSSSRFELSVADPPPVDVSEARSSWSLRKRSVTGQRAAGAPPSADVAAVLGVATRASASGAGPESCWRRTRFMMRTPRARRARPRSGGPPCPRA